MTRARRLAFVVQRYGAEITGGSETLARALAERLAGTHAVTVLTTCARDYVTWRNELPAGRGTENAVEVLRFPTTEERDLAAFNAFAEPLYSRAAGAASPPPSAEEEQAFLRRQGPHVPALVEHLRTTREHYDVRVFFTYLYYPTVAGLAAVPERSVLVPTAHDEPPLRFALYAAAFEAARGLAFLTPAEQRLVATRFTLGARPALVAGLGVEVPEQPDVQAFRRRFDVQRPYLAYAGRIDAGKGCAELLALHARCAARQRGAPDLLLLGRLAMPEPRQPGVRYLGWLDEADKLAALAGAQAVVCPSAFESLSIVLLEALGQGTPVIVNARSDVLVEHCLRSQAGLYYRDADEFAELVALLAQAPALRAALGENGRRYVRREYAWDAVLARWQALLDEVAAGA